MHMYDYIIIGSGYSSAGFALKNGNCVICEESQCCDPNFYLPLRSFIHREYTPETELGKELCGVFNKHALFDGSYMCTNAFESAFCEFLWDKSIDILLKCRVVSIEKKDDGTFIATVYTNEGLSTLYAKNIIDTTPCQRDEKSYMTVLYMTEKTQEAEKALSEVFDSGIFTKAFYENRYALHIPVTETEDVNEMLCRINDKWLTVQTDARILYASPVFYSIPHNKEYDKSTFPKDYYFENPIAAFEEGIFFAGGGVK